MKFFEFKIGVSSKEWLWKEIFTKSYFNFEAIYLKVKRFIVSSFNPKLIKNNAMKLNMAVPSIDDIDIKNKLLH